MRPAGALAVVMLASSPVSTVPTVLIVLAAVLIVLPALAQIALAQTALLAVRS